MTWENDKGLIMDKIKSMEELCEKFQALQLDFTDFRRDIKNKIWIIGAIAALSGGIGKGLSSLLTHLF